MTALSIPRTSRHVHFDKLCRQLSRVARTGVLGAGAFLNSSCATAELEAGDAAEASRAEIRRAMERYMIAARAVNADSVATFFAPHGVLLEPGIFPIQTPDSIRAFMSSFPGVHVDSADVVPDTIEIHGNTALLWGSYFEKLSFPGQPTSEQHGKFVIEWVRGSDGRWLIERYYRVPLPGPPRSSPNPSE